MYDPDEKEISYKLLAGSHRIGKKQYEKGDTIKGTPSSLQSIRHRLQPLEEEPIARVVTRNVTPSYTKEHRGGGKYRVINDATGEAVNEELYTSTQADKFIASLLGYDVEEEENEEDEEEEDDEA